jgi:hypothetical protein
MTAYPEGKSAGGMIAKEQDELLSGARAGVDEARLVLVKARGRLEVIEQNVRRCWRSRKAALGSLKSTIAAQRNCGSTGNAVARLSLARIQGRADNATSEIHALVDSAGETCREFHCAWNGYLSARNTERKVLETIAVAIAARPSEEAITARRRSEARAELERLEPVRRKEEEARRADFGVESGRHFDPNYDERELMLRRIRPWV